MVRAKKESDFYDCCELVHSKCIESKYANNAEELKKMKEMFKLERKVAHIHMIDGGNS